MRDLALGPVGSWALGGLLALGFLEKDVSSFSLGLR
jgi:hypothetical protein